jgi:Flp pilus assembly protein TadB
VDGNVIVILAGLATFGAVWFLLNWIHESRRLSSLTYVEVRNAQIEEALHLERRGNRQQRTRARLRELGYQGDPAPLAIGVMFGYLVLAAVLTVAGLEPLQALAVALPTAFAGSFIGLRIARKRRHANAGAQVLQLLRTAVSYLESGNNPAQAFAKSAMLVDNPLRSDVAGLLASRVGTEPLAVALAPLSEKYPSQAMTLMLAALEVNDMVGSKLVPTLKQAEKIIEQQTELAAEANAEVSQAKAEFLGISIIIGLVGFLMLLSGGAQAKAAYASPLGIILIAIGVGNFALGVWRTMRVLAKARSGDL